MKYHREFEIPWFGLKEGKHEFRYLVTKQVIEGLGFENNDFQQLEAQVVLSLEKQNSFLQLHFDIGGFVEVPCDRCGDLFKMQLWDEFDLIVKFTSDMDEEEAEDMDEADIVFIPRSETILDVSGWIYEFILLSMPLQHIHPDLPDGTPGCNPEALKLLERMSPGDDKKKSLWAGLEQFKRPDDHKDN